MKIQVNGKAVEFEKGTTVRELLVTQKAEMQEYVTVQVNDAFVPREEFDNRKVSDGDVVEFLYFMGGGER